MISQRPQLAEAMRRALAIPEGFQLSADSVIVPTFNVGTVPSDDDPAFDDYSAWVSINAVAAQYSRVQLQWLAANPRVQRCEITKVTLNQGTTGYVFIGWGTPQPFGTVGWSQPKRQIPAGLGNLGAIRIFNDNSATAPISTDYGFIVMCPANVPVVCDFRDSPWAIMAPGVGAAPGLNITAANVNTNLAVAAEIREWRAAV